MNESTATSKILKRAALATLLLLIAIMTAACGSMMMLGHGAKKPAASEFGLGPRTSAQARYIATLQPAQPLAVRKLQTVQVTIADAAGKPLDGATFTVDGGMPQHGHGLPTRPRLTKSLGNGTYEIEGVRFNMRGWWEFKLAINGPAGADTVTFNIAL